jgi:hypothetical protein
MIDEMRGGPRAARQLDEEPREQRQHDCGHSQEHANPGVQRLACDRIRAGKTDGAHQ